MIRKLLIILFLLGTYVWAVETETPQPSAITVHISQTKAQYQTLKNQLGYDPCVKVFIKINDTIMIFDHTNDDFGIDHMCKKIITGYHHGFGDDGSTAIRLGMEENLFSCGYTFNFADCQGQGKVDNNKASIGQHNDAQAASLIASYINDLYNPQTINFYGRSRGGAVVLRLLGEQHKKSKEYRYLNSAVRNKLSSAILDAPLGDVRDVIRYKRQQITQKKGSVFQRVSSAFHNMCSMVSRGSTSSLESLGNATDIIIHHSFPLIFKKHDVRAIAPQECVKTVDPKIALFMFTTKDDTLIRPETIYTIARHRITSAPDAKEKTYTYMASHGGHVGALRNDPDRSALQSAIHAFREKHNAGDVNEKLAHNGKTVLKEQCTTADIANKS